MTEVIRFIGYYLGIVVTDVAIGLWKESRMRKLTKYTNDNDGSVLAHVVTEATAGPVTVVGGAGYDAKPGDVLIATDRSDVYHAAGSDALSGYSEHGDTDQGDQDSDADDSGEDTEDTTTDYNPSEYSALEVKQYLERKRNEGNRAEFDRVSAAESAGKNRGSALVGAFDK